MPHHTNQTAPNSENHSDADVQTMFAEQYFRDQQQHWADSYDEDTDGKPPTRGGVVKMGTNLKPKPKPAPVNNPPVESPCKPCPYKHVSPPTRRRSFQQPESVTQ